MINNLFDSQCGTQNPLVKLTNQLNLSNDHQKNYILNQQKSNLNAAAANKSDEFVNEYLNDRLGANAQLPFQAVARAPNTFHMGSLISELKQVDDTATSFNQSLILNDSSKAQAWTNEFENAFAAKSKPTTTTRQQQRQTKLLSDNSLKWSVDYLKQNESKILDENDIFKFNEMRNNLMANEPKLRLFNGEEEESQEQQDLSDQWIKEFIETEGADQETDKGDFWSEFQHEWKSSELFDQGQQPWLEDFQKTFDSYRAYEFDEQNHLESHPNPFEEGLERLKVHDIVNAVLLFEVAVKKDPNNMLAWQYLGTTQVENEQDVQAIRALRKCLELKPDNLIALSTIATSYTNESMQRLAFNSLLKWLKFNANYSMLFETNEKAKRLWNDFVMSKENTSNSSFYNILGVVHIRDFLDLQEIYLEAIRSHSPSTANRIDPDLQSCLGILSHLSGDYDKAADCFRTALQVKPDDHLLWNKLGATYANNSLNEESIQAYYQALQLCPGFVRARYNLGIGCLNLKAYKESIEHFLTSLVQQSQANIDNPGNKSMISKSQQMSETIWNTLRLALSYLDRSDLIEACNSKNLDLLRNEFKV